MAKVKKTFRIEEDAYDELVKLSVGWGVAQGAAVERAIRLARQMPDTCQTDASTPDGGDSAAVAALIGQLAKKRPWPTAPRPCRALRRSTTRPPRRSRWNRPSRS